VALLGSVFGGWVSWLLGSLLGTWVYLAVSALEIALARNVHLTVGDTDPEER
jgi:membrane protein YqaA with SNARE-associated domain